LESWVGETLPVLFEAGGQGRAPNYVQVRIDRPVPRNTLADAVVTGVGDGFLRGRLLEEGG
ncbi:MAG: tRNA (N(6)-L-threonylcarbamoyladenosine(37)-C(2))-methylthiotransferase MtaB, partial [Oscillospiraceae bacterium]|nr:tRNA (N(6)-L-threonylcarbamoyladenosine(37)-C(2))-methylthiotransferase MtaB [Oscillospiraceae bacterium]